LSKRLLTEAQEIAFGGERVTHLVPNDCYYAHLSIYYFALNYIQGKDVLDAGSGSGYGSHYLATNGAKSVEAIDISEVAVQFSKKYFSVPNLHYQAIDLENIEGFSPGQFDIVFSSNVLEHVPNVEKFFLSVNKLIKPDGTLILAVPPVADDISRKNNLENVYHLNIWTPRQWFMVLSRFFENISPYYHTFDNPSLSLDFLNTPEQTRVNEKDFTFRPIELDDFYQKVPLTVMFIAKNPKVQAEINPYIFIEDSITRPLQIQESVNGNLGADSNAYFGKSQRVRIKDLYKKIKHFLRRL
jgi:SAM-dependent methyltransferase